MPVLAIIGHHAATIPTQHLSPTQGRNLGLGLSWTINPAKWRFVTPTRRSAGEGEAQIQARRAHVGTAAFKPAASDFDA